MSPKNKNQAKSQVIPEKVELITSNSTRATKEYVVIVGSCAEELTKLVNDKINEDWDVLGGVSSCIETSPYHSRIVMSQALTRTKK